jgi:tRNA wybutosine-synthesizing protein 3
MVAVRSTGLAFDTVVGYENQEGTINSIVTEVHLRLMVGLANERFVVNSERISRFRSALLSSYQPLNDLGNNSTKITPDWEDRAIRQARKREEGLARQKILKTIEQESKGSEPTLALEQSDDR